MSVVSHDSESRTLVNDYGAFGSYVRNVHYTGAGLTSVPQVAGLLDISAHCEQFIKYECYGSISCVCYFKNVVSFKHNAR